MRGYASAAEPRDPTRPADVVGVPLDQIDVAAAQEVCELAAQLYPDDPRRLYQLGRVYYASGSMDDAFSSFNAAAAMGSPGAALSLGQMYQKGEGVAPDIQRARQHYERAAEAGHTDAMLLLARLYIEGNGVPRDARKAGELFGQAKAALQQR